MSQGCLRSKEAFLGLWQDRTLESFPYRQWNFQRIRGIPRFIRIFGHPWDQCKSEEKPESLWLGGGGYLRNYMAHRSGSHIKICRFRPGIVCQSFQNCMSLTYSSNLRETCPISSCFWLAIARRTDFQPLFQLYVSLPDWASQWKAGLQSQEYAKSQNASWDHMY